MPADAISSGSRSRRPSTTIGCAIASRRWRQSRVAKSGHSVPMTAASTPATPPRRSSQCRSMARRRRHSPTPAGRSPGPQRRHRRGAPATRTAGESRTSSVPDLNASPSMATERADPGPIASRTRRAKWRWVPALAAEAAAGTCIVTPRSQPASVIVWSSFGRQLPPKPYDGRRYEVPIRGS